MPAGNGGRPRGITHGPGRTGEVKHTKSRKTGNSAYMHAQRTMGRILIFFQLMSCRMVPILLKKSILAWRKRQCRCPEAGTSRFTLHAEVTAGSRSKPDNCEPTFFDWAARISNLLMSICLLRVEKISVYVALFVVDACRQNYRFSSTSCVSPPPSPRAMLYATWPATIACGHGLAHIEKVPPARV